MKIYEKIKSFFTPKCDFCGEPETQDDIFLVEVSTEAGIQGHQSCWERTYDVEAAKQSARNKAKEMFKNGEFTRWKMKQKMFQKK